MRKTLLALAFPLAGSVFSAGCGDPLDDRPATFGYVHAAIIRPSCTAARCHSELSRTEDLNLEDVDKAYEILVEGGLAIPGEPGQSELLYLLRGDAVDTRMPPDVPLPDGDIALIERWILEGAVR